MKMLPNGAWPDHIPRRQVGFLFCSVLCFDISISIVWQPVFSSMASLFYSTLALAQRVFVNIQMTCILHTSVHTSVCLYLCFNISSTSSSSDSLSEYSSTDDASDSDNGDDDVSNSNVCHPTTEPHQKVPEWVLAEWDDEGEPMLLVKWKVNSLLSSTASA